MTLSAAPTTASRRHRVATRVQDGATVEGDVVVLGSPGNVPRSALRGLIQPLSDCSVVLACAVEAGSETGRVRGTDLARRWLIRAEAPTELGPVALRSSALGGERRPGAIDIATLVELLRRGDAVTIDAGSLAPQGAPDQRRRWLAPAEVKAWLAAVDLAALAGDLAPEDELAATAALLRRAVLLPDLATAGAAALGGLPALELLAERADALIAGRPLQRSERPSLVLLGTGAAAAAAPPPESRHWLRGAPEGAGGFRRIGASVLLVGDQADASDLDRFAPPLDTGTTGGAVRPARYRAAAPGGTVMVDTIASRHRPLPPEVTP